uniref:Uncharacterized protein n=1 Tax=Strongyloides venezuelensis TaxID=75913 RepID=A0A0K0FB93_STRVS
MCQRNYIRLVVSEEYDMLFFIQFFINKYLSFLRRCKLSRKSQIFLSFFSHKISSQTDYEIKKFSIRGVVG